MSTHYKLSWNYDYYRIGDFLNDVKRGNHTGFLMQQLNKGKNITIPAVGSTATITAGKKAIARCEVKSDPVYGYFQDDYDIGSHNREKKNWVIIKITEVIDEPFALKGNQMTWCRMTT